MFTGPDNRIIVGLNVLPLEVERVCRMTYRFKTKKLFLVRGPYDNVAQLRFGRNSELNSVGRPLDDGRAHPSRCRLH